MPYGPLFGIIMRWKGHYNWDNKQPRNGYSPLGAIGGYQWISSTEGYRLRILGTEGALLRIIAEDTSGKQLKVGVPYMFKMRGQTIGNDTLYSLKVWEQGAAEPSNWTISGYGVSGELKQGSVLLMSHYSMRNSVT